MKPFPRSHPRSLAQSKGIGERGWRRGRASIPLVNLSERILCSIGRDPRFVVATAREHCPGDAGELVGERDRQQIAMGKAPGNLLDPWPQGAHCRGRPPLDDDVSGLHEEGAQVLIAALGDSALCRARHKADYADRRTMPNRADFPGIHRDLHVVDSA